jgi:hypothetical protein
VGKFGEALAQRSTFNLAQRSCANRFARAAHLCCATAGAPTDLSSFEERRFFFAAQPSDLKRAQRSKTAFFLCCATFGTFGLKEVRFRKRERHLF